MGEHIECKGIINMKIRLIIISCIILSSCSGHKQTYSPYWVAYEEVNAGPIPPAYIFLRTRPQFFELYCPSIYESILGKYTIHNDTLILSLDMEVLDGSSGFIVSKTTTADTNLTIIPKKLLISKDRLLDTTDYDFKDILPEPFNDIKYKRDFKRIK